MPLPVAFCAVFAGRFFLLLVLFGFVVSSDNLLADLKQEIDDVVASIKAEKKELMAGYGGQRRRR
jgi:hypothetical protein